MPNPRTGPNRPAQQGQPTNNAQAKLDRALVRWTSAVAVFTGLLFVASAISDWFIWAELKNTETAQSLTQEQLRASLAILGVAENPGIEARTGKPTLGFIANLQNIGGTRTAWAHGWVSIHYFPDKVPNNFDVAKPYDELPPSVPDNVVAANASFPLAAGLDPQEVKAAVDSEKGVILFWGRAEYATIYEPKKSIGLGFCFVMNPIKPKVQKANVADNSAASVPGNNGATEKDSTGPFAFVPTPYKPDCNYSH